MTVANFIIGIGVIIGLLIAVIEYACKYFKEKKYIELVEVVLDRIKIAEKLYKKGISKKEFVMNEVKAAAETIGYKLDEEQMSNFIDSVVELTKKVNVKKEVKK